MKRRQALLSLMTAPLACHSAESAAPLPQFVPQQTVRLIVPNAPGGAMDIIARALCHQLSMLWQNQSVIPDYKPGAGTLLGTELLARSRADGHVLGMVATPLVIQPALKPVRFHIEKDLTPLVRIGTSDLLLSCSPSMESASLNQIFERVRARPGQYSCATAGLGSAMHMTLELLQQRTGMDLIHVPFNGSGPAFVELAAGRVDFLIEPVFSCLPHIAQNRLRPLASTGRQRHALLSNVPCLHESIQGLVVQSFFGLAAPGGMSQPLVRALQEDLWTVMNQGAWRERLQSQGVEHAPLRSAAFAEYLSDQSSFWARLVKERGLRLPE